MENHMAQNTDNQPKPTKTQIPIARVKRILKQDPDVNKISVDAAYVFTKSTV